MRMCVAPIETCSSAAAVNLSFLSLCVYLLACTCICVCVRVHVCVCVCARHQPASCGDEQDVKLVELTCVDRDLSVTIYNHTAQSRDTLSPGQQRKHARMHARTNKQTNNKQNAHMRWAITQKMIFCAFPAVEQALRDFNIQLVLGNVESTFTALMAVVKLVDAKAAYLFKSYAERYQQGFVKEKMTGIPPSVLVRCEGGGGVRRLGRGSMGKKTQFCYCIDVFYPDDHYIIILNNSSPLYLPLI